MQLLGDGPALQDSCKSHSKTRMVPFANASILSLFVLADALFFFLQRAEDEEGYGAAHMAWLKTAFLSSGCFIVSKTVVPLV